MVKKEKYNVVVVGVGAVGIEMLRILKQRHFPIGELCVFARSARDIEMEGFKYSVREISVEGFKGIDIALFAGTEGEKGASLTYAPEAVKKGAVVIDNGADFRMDPDVPLIVPEVNANDITPVKDWFLSGSSDISKGAKKHKGIIANPNCSTIQMVMVLWPIYKKVGIKRVIVTTFQAASGAGRSAVEQLTEESMLLNKVKYQNIKISECQKRALPQQLAFNVFPHIGGFGEFAYTSEEWKMVKETHKIMHDDKINLSATCVRVPVRTGHAEAIYIETKEFISPKKTREVLSRASGIKVIDEPQKSLYPQPKDIEGKDDVFVGRIRQDPFIKNGLWLWVVADNLRKGASLNAIQIAECVISG